MAKRLLARTILNFNVLQIKPTLCVFANIQVKNLHNNSEVTAKEVQIPTPWGHFAAKLWGSDTTKRPILALHGWQDNAGTWDPLIPMIVKDRPILAVDFPGHGLSSWIPKGMQYYSWELPRHVLAIKEHFKWDKVSLLGHSMGSIAALRFASIYPNDVDFYIGVDILVHEDYDLNFVIDKYPTVIKKTLDAQSRLDEEPPSYTMEEMKKKWHLGTRKSIDLDRVHYLANRGTKASKNDPNKFYFSRDSRLKYTLFNPEDKKFVEALIRRLKCPSLYVKAIDSPYATDAFAVEMQEIVENSNELFETQFIPGTHHVHLNNPDKVAPLILNFYQKYKIDY